MRWYGWLLAALAIGTAVPARGDAPRSSSLSWTRLPGAEQCIAARALAEAIEKRLGRSVFVSAAQGEVSVEARVQPERAGRGWLAVIAIASSDGKVLGTRELRSAEASCRALDDQLALVIALLIDPDAAMGEQNAPAASAATSAIPPPPQVIIQRETVVVPVEVPAPPKAETWRMGAEVGPVFAVGLLPGFAYGAGARVTIDPPWRWPVVVDGSVWREAEATEQGGTAKFRLAMAGLSLCPLQVGRSRTRVMACAGGHLGSLRMQSMDYQVNHEQEKLAADVSIQGRVAYRIAGPLKASAGAGVLMPLERDRFFVRISDGSTPEVFRMAPVAAWLDLGVGVELP